MFEGTNAPSHPPPPPYLGVDAIDGPRRAHREPLELIAAAGSRRAATGVAVGGGDDRARVDQGGRARAAADQHELERRVHTRVETGGCAVRTQHRPSARRGKTTARCLERRVIAGDELERRLRALCVVLARHDRVVADVECLERERPERLGGTDVDRSERRRRRNIDRSVAQSRRRRVESRRGERDRVARARRG